MIKGIHRLCFHSHHRASGKTCCGSLCRHASNIANELPDNGQQGVFDDSSDRLEETGVLLVLNDGLTGDNGCHLGRHVIPLHTTLDQLVHAGVDVSTQLVGKVGAFVLGNQLLGI